MTLLISVAGQRAVWLSADRQLSQNGTPVKDDAIKVMWLDTEDGQAILAYTGLGATGSGTELSKWMSNVLRGRNLSLESSIAALGDAMERGLPPHLDASVPHHHLAVASVINKSAFLSSVDLNWNGAFYKATVGKREKRSLDGPPLIKPKGSGVRHITSTQRTAISKLVRAHDKGKATDLEVMQALAHVNEAVAKVEPTVSAACIVTSRHKPNGGGNVHFHGRPSQLGEYIPHIGRGMDWGTFTSMLMPEAMKWGIGALGKGPAYEMNVDGIVEEFNKLPEGPDEKLL